MTSRTETGKLVLCGKLTTKLQHLAKSQFYVLTDQVFKAPDPSADRISPVKSLRQNTIVIFTTAFSEYAVTSYELNAFDYLLKPINLQNAVDTYYTLKIYPKMKTRLPEENPWPSVINLFK